MTPNERELPEWKPIHFSLPVQILYGEHFKVLECGLVVPVVSKPHDDFDAALRANARNN